MALADLKKLQCPDHFANFIRQQTKKTEPNFIKTAEEESTQLANDESDDETDNDTDDDWIDGKNDLEQSFSKEMNSKVAKCQYVTEERITGATLVAAEIQLLELAKQQQVVAY